MQPSTPEATARSRRVPGIDAIRFVLAAIVVFGHFGFLPIPGVTSGPGSNTAVRAVLESLFNGQAAVIGFFLISGFCIHSAYVDSEKIHVGAYFARRELRIVLPVVAAFGVGLLVHSFLFSTILWSLVCEEIYYSLYPVVLAARRRSGWTNIFVAAGVGAVAALVYGVSKHDPSHAFHDLGYTLTWLLGYPIWLAGCVLAERAPHMRDWVGPASKIWAARGLIWVLSIACLMLRFHPGHGVSNEILMPLFAVPAYFWLAAEVRYFQTHGAPRWLDRWGRASYSLYLVHMLAPALFALSVPTVRASLLPWSIAMLGTAVLTAAFYFAVELPSHRLARRF